MKIRISIFSGILKLCKLVILISFFYACEGNTASKTNKPLSFNKVQHVVIQSDTLQSYELYMPSSTMNAKKLPVVFMFDPHGSGAFALEQGKEAAERYGYILAGSNNSKNGVQNTAAITSALMADVLKRFPVDESRIYAAGFSGGGRVASSLALSSGKIRGIITCSAGLPNFDPLSATSKFEIYATAGKHDFNFDEVSSISTLLDKTDWKHLVTAFNGGHSWPPASFLDEAFAWFNINAMHDGLLPKDKDFLKQIHDEVLVKTDQYLASGQFLAAANECRNGTAKLDGLYNVKKLRKKLETIQKMEEFNLEKQKAERVKFTEFKLRDAYMQNFTTQNVAWWTNEINSLNDRVAHEKDSLNRQMYSRVKGFLGIICYSYTARAIHSGDYATAESCLSVYQAAEPQNPDCLYFKALLSDKKNNTKEATENLLRALKLGFSDASKLKEFSKKTLIAAGMAK